MFDRVVGRSWPPIVLGVVAPAATFPLAARGATRGVRVVAAAGAAALVWTWGVAQYPYLLPFELTIAESACAGVTQRWLVAWFVVALLGPALALLYLLDQRGELGEDPTMSSTDETPAPSGPA
jgi:cytochrome d ubiquinol oxidase subunit II